MGFPMFPTKRTSCLLSFKTSYKIFAVVDLPLVPVIVIFLFFLLLQKKISKSVKIFLDLFFKYLLSLQLLTSIPGLITIQSTFLFNKFL